MVLRTSNVNDDDNDDGYSHSGQAVISHPPHQIRFSHCIENVMSHVPSIERLQQLHVAVQTLEHLILYLRMFPAKLLEAITCTDYKNYGTSPLVVIDSCHLSRAKILFVLNRWGL